MKKRFLALDVLRGLTIMLMIIVNNPGSYECTFPALRHSAWDGCTLCDLVFPFFLFCVGVSMAFTLAKHASLSDALGKILKRGVLMYLLGVAILAFPFFPAREAMDPSLNFRQNWMVWAEGVRLTSVLSRIALCYILGSVLVLWLRKPLRLCAAIAVLCALHVGLLLIFAGPEGAFTLEGNFARRLDIAIFGESHIYHGYGVPFDPEGLLGVLTGTCTALLGYLAGTFVRNGVSGSALRNLFIISTISLALGLVFNIWIPINKPLWSVSYVFYAGGWAVFALASIAWMTDLKGWEKPFLPFKIMGMNAIAIYVLAEMTMRMVWRYTDWDFSILFGADEMMSMLFGILYMLVNLAVASLLYKKGIFIRL